MMVLVMKPIGVASRGMVFSTRGGKKALAGPG